MHIIYNIPDCINIIIMCTYGQSWQMVLRTGLDLTCMCMYILYTHIRSYRQALASKQVSASKQVRSRRTPSDLNGFAGMRDWKPVPGLPLCMTVCQGTRARASAHVLLSPWGRRALARAP